MLRLAKINRILDVMKDKKKIRNVGVLAHIDHGKTTLTDLLLAEAGLIPYELAGEIRVLDYLREEQRRGITIKAANISLLCEVYGEEYVINLVDTPGHVDFTDRVTRALRIIDGAIILVDAVEEVMAQTEVVVRQALNERVKPILFINKVDRLINELRMSVEEIRDKILRIIRSLNDLIDTYSESQFKNTWRLDLSEGDVIIGSALHKWGLTARISKEKKIKISDIIETYKSGELWVLREEIPLSKIILSAIVEKLPDPATAQKYRIPKIWSGDLNSEIGRAMINCSPEGPTTVYIANVKMDPKENCLVATGRVFSGRISVGDEVYLVGAGTEYKIKGISIYMGPLRESVPSLDSGNIVAIPGLKSITAGETIVEAKYGDVMVPFERIKRVSEPVITVSVEPRDPKDLPRLINTLNIISIEDPSFTVSINEETGEYLLSGIGELHIDIALKTLKEYEPDLEVIVSRPIISYRESVSKRGEPATAFSPSGLNWVTVVVEPVKELSLKEDERLIRVSDSNVLVRSVNGIVTGEGLEAIIRGFEWACRSGPLCCEPIKDVKVKIIAAQLGGVSEERSYAQLIPAVRKAIHESFLTAGPILLEPIYSIQVIAPTEYIGVVSNILARRRGKIISMHPRGFITIIDGLIPVAESMELANELRSASSGRVFWQCSFLDWERVPIDAMPKIITSIRARKGLPVGSAR